jgi:hypothetical protein
MATFDFTCPQCGVSVEADDSYRGMVLECPSCGKGIVVPRGTPVHHSKLKPVASRQDRQEDLNVVAMRRMLAEHEAADTAKRAEERARRRIRLLFMAVNLVISVAVLGALAYGVRAWWNRKAEQERAREEARQKEEAENARAKEARDAELQKRREASKQKQLEEAAKRAEAAKLREEKREREREELKQQREKREKERQDKIAAAAALAKERKDRVEKFDRIEKALKGATVDLWNNLPKESRPGAVQGTFYCLIPFDKDYGVYEVESFTNGPMRVAKLSKKEADEPIEIADYSGLVAKLGCLCLPADGKTAYVTAPSGSEGEKYVVPSSSVMPAALLWGEGLCALIKRYSMETGNLEYDVSYLSARGKALPLGQFAFGQLLGRTQLQEAVLAVAFKNWKPPKTKSKTFRRTVMFYDGKTIKKGADGVTYVPRSPDGRVGSSYGKLCDEAMRQEEMQAASQKEQEEESTRVKENFREGVISAIPDGSLQVTVKSVEK